MYIYILYTKLLSHINRCVNVLIDVYYSTDDIFVDTCFFKWITTLGAFDIGRKCLSEKKIFNYLLLTYHLEM